MESEMSRATASVKTRETYVVRRLKDRETIRSLLEPRRVYTAYALGQLEPRRFPFSQWWLAEGDGGRALLLHSWRGLGNALFVMGDADAVCALLSLHPGPRNSFATCEAEHLGVLRRFYYFSQDHPVSRMKVTAATFRPSQSPPQGETRRLTDRDARWMNRLYGAEGAVATYTARQIEEGVYFGAWVGERLVAVAGTHSVSPAHGVAVVGNVYTHPHYRCRGLGTLVTDAVTAAVIDSCPLVVLSVDPRNGAGVRAYQKLGFEEDSRIIEAAVSRKDFVGLRSFVRRLSASLRGRGTGGALVRL